MVRVIGHLDLDYFYAQVEEVENPSLKGRPVLVCVFSGRTADSGVVATVNYPAREFGARSGMPIALAKKKLEGKEPVLVRMERAKYEAVSARVMQLVRDEVDALEQVGIDEAFFDITRRSNADFTIVGKLANKIKGSILTSEGLTCSVGVGRSKVVAKVASDFRKPDGLTAIAPEETSSFLGPLPVTRLYGVGPKTAHVLEGLGIKTVGELAAAPIPDIERVLGKKLGVYLNSAANGLDDEPVSPKQGPTQLSRIITLKQNTLDPDAALAQLVEATEDLHRKLAAGGVSFRTITAIAILADLSTKTRSRTFEVPMSNLATIREGTRALLKDLSGSVHREFRRVGVRLSDLTSADDQTSLTQFLQGKRVEAN